MKFEAGWLRATLLGASLGLVAGGSALAESAPGSLEVKDFLLDNGMEVVVIPDHRAPIVTHMVWYKVGSADEPPGKSGIAHFFEHLMFKATSNHPAGEFDRAVSDIGGSNNAFTSYDYTAFHETVAPSALEQMMSFEADRMRNLILTDDVIKTERDVILEERRSRIDNNPSALLDEQMNAALYLNDPYGTPVIGWYHEMQKLSRQDALTFYKHYYAPNNAILIVSGDVTPEEVKTLAEASYGKIPNNPDVTTVRHRPSDPPPLAPRRLEIKDPRAGNYSLQRYYLTPSYVTAKPGEAEALDLLMKITGSGTTSRIYKKLVVESKLATSAGGDYSGSNLDSGNISLYAVAADGVPLPKVEAAIDDVLAEVVKNGVTEAELARAKRSYLADYIYESDNQATLARRYGWNLAIGRTVADVENWPAAISKVTADDVKKVAGEYLNLKASVTGYLIPDQSGVAQAQDAPPPSANSELR